MKSLTKSTNMQCSVKKTNRKKDHAFSLFKYIYIYIYSCLMLCKKNKQEKRKENSILYVYIVTQ